MSTGDGSPRRGSDSCLGRTSTGKEAARKPRFFTIADVAEILNLSTRSVRRLIDGDKLPIYRFGSAVRIAETDLRALIATHRVD